MTKSTILPIDETVVDKNQKNQKTKNENRRGVKWENIVPRNTGGGRPRP